MTDWIVSQSSLSGTLVIPPSKSQSIRALIFAMMAEGKSVLRNLLPSPDIAAMMLACEHLGAKIERFQDRIEVIGINGKINGSEDVIFAGNSGLVLRFIGALAGLSDKPIVLTGDQSVRHNREVAPLIDALSQLGAQAFSLRGSGAPIFVKGPFLSNSATFLGEDSQPVSGMLIAASFASFPIDLYVVNAGEKPWVAMTLSWLDKLGISYRASNFERYHLSGRASYGGFSYTVAGDYSSSAFPLAAALLTNSELTLENLDPKDSQGDQKLVKILKEMGARIEVDEENKRLNIKKNSTLQGIKIDVNECIDALPILAVVGCFAEGQTHLTGAKIARRKESDRIACMTKELRKMGAQIEEEEDGLIIKHSSLKGSEVESHHDHRVAMSLAVAGLAASGKTKICKTACVSKSYPNFLNDLKYLGANLQGG